MEQATEDVNSIRVLGLTGSLEERSIFTYEACSRHSHFSHLEKRWRNAFGDTEYSTQEGFLSIFTGLEDNNDSIKTEE